MSEDELCDSLAEWAGMLPGKQPYMQKAILGNLAIFMNELARRIDVSPKPNATVRYGAPRHPK